MMDAAVGKRVAGQLPTIEGADPTIAKARGPVTDRRRYWILDRSGSWPRVSWS